MKKLIILMGMCRDCTFFSIETKDVLKLGKKEEREQKLTMLDNVLLVVFVKDVIIFLVSITTYYCLL